MQKNKKIMLLNSEILNTVRKRIDESKQIPNYSNYVILPNEGLVYSLKRNKFIGCKDYQNYLKCTLYSDIRKVWTTKIHRVIYTACYGEIPEGLDVNHIDENHNNNSIFNLNLMTHKDNCNWGTRNERMAKKLKGKYVNRTDQSKPVVAYKNEELVMTFPSAREADRCGFERAAVAKCCKGKRKSYKGYEWRYIEKESA